MKKTNEIFTYVVQSRFAERHKLFQLTFIYAHLAASIILRVVATQNRLCFQIKIVVLHGAISTNMWSFELRAIGTNAHRVDTHFFHLKMHFQPNPSM